jgi:hypothetical protein
MFQTQDHAKIHSSLIETGENLWAYCELSINSEWLFVDCIVKENGLNIATSYFLSSPIQLMRLIESAEVEVMKVYLVSPPGINFSPSWEMNQLLKISRAKMVDSDLQVDIYKLKNGKNLYSINDLNFENLRSVKVLYEST